MKVVLFGASGMIGSRILQELIRRRHEVTGVVRSPEKITVSGVKVVKGDVTDEVSVAKASRARMP
jgi:putative NADH-flavin reductase